MKTDMKTEDFILIPAIDLREGCCVRLRQGRMEEAKIYSDDPASMALHWQALGAQRLHVVDLDGAMAGKPVNRQAIRAICRAVRIPVQLGGGLRDLNAIREAFDLGVDRVILGSASVSNPSLVHEACMTYPGRILVGIDARGGKVAVHGWEDTTEMDAISLAKRMENAGVAGIVYTDIARDGMLIGPNIEETVALARAIRIPVIASGGIASLNDVLALAAHAKDGICGAITGKAIYEGTLDFAEALAALHAQKEGAC